MRLMVRVWQAGQSFNRGSDGAKKDIPMYGIILEFCAMNIT